MPDHNDSLHTPADSAAHGAQTPAETGHAAGGESAFTTLLNQLGDHRELSIGPWHLPLPVILIDDGVSVYGSMHAMEEGGRYTFDQTAHSVLRTDTKQPPSLDLSVTSLVAFQWLAMILLVSIFIPMARSYRSRGARPLGRFFNAMEAVVIYVRDEIVLPNVGDAGKPMLPIFFTFFFFILTMNLVGLVPLMHTATGSLNVTAGLAIIAFFVMQLAGIFKNGFVSWLKHLTGGVPAWLWFIMVPVEILGLFTKPFALAVRLFANMTAGHVILLSLIGLTFVSALFIPVMIGFSLFIYVLELLVAFLQAYIFTMLTAVFAGIAMASHDHDEHHGPAHALAHAADGTVADGTVAGHDAGAHAVAH